MEALKKIVAILFILIVFCFLSVAYGETLKVEGTSEQTLPDWIKNLKFKGDFRLRYQKEKKQGSQERYRKRMRLRFGFEEKINSNTKVFFGLASGATDPRTTTQTFENTFEVKNIRLDYAYAEFTPCNYSTLTGGKIKNPIWEPGELLWDTDINPEGGAINFKKDVNSELNVFINSAVFILDESSTQKDPWMFVYQPGLKYKISDTINLNFAVSYYGFENVKGAKLDYTANSNTGSDATPAKEYTYDYDALNSSIELGIKNPISFIPVLSFFGEHVHNNTISNENTGYLGGIKLGHDKIKDCGQWQLKYVKKSLDKDAWVDALPDSDNYSGKTGIVGNEVTFVYGLGENANFEINYSNNDLKNDKTKTESLLQMDINFKF